MTVRPPENVRNPVTVQVVDYGKHAGLVLPAGNGKWVEYSWGDWRFFAMADTSVPSGVRALLASDASTVSRRYVSQTVTFDELKRDWGVQRVIAFQVERDRANRLLGELTARFDRRIDTAFYNKDYGQDFTQDKRHYWLLYNCTHETAAWLRELGCRVKGWSLMSEFVMSK